MEIKKLSIENYRSLKKIDINGFNPTTIFYGDNNAGKSNILNCLQLIFQRKRKMIESGLENFYTGVIADSLDNFYNHNTSNPIKFNVEIEVDKDELTIDSAIQTLFKKAGKYTFTFRGIIRALDPIEYNRSEIIMQEILEGKNSIYTNGETGYHFFPVLDKDSKKQSDFERAFTQLINLFNDCVYVIGSDRDMLEIDFNDEAKFDLTARTFKKVLHNLYLSSKKYPYFEEIDNVFSKSPFSYGHISFAQEGQRLEIMIKEGGFRLPIKHLGSGVLQSLYIITAIVLSKSKIVCVEELEQNLSPNKQYEILKKIQSMIAEPQLSINQLIITSHSSVYSKPKLGTIYFLEKTDGQTKVSEAYIKTGKVGKEVITLSDSLKQHFEPVAYTPMTPEEFKAFQRKIEGDHDLR